MERASCHGIVLSEAHHTIKRDKLRFLGQSGAPGEAGTVPHPPRASHAAPCPGNGGGPGPQAIRGGHRRARSRVPSLPTRAHAADQNGVSTASGVGPLCSRAWTGHVIEEVDTAALVRLPDNGPVPPGGAWCVHKQRQGVLTEAMRWSK